MSETLKPCRKCGSPGSTQLFSVGTIYLCSKSTLLNGSCDEDISLSLDHWNWRDAVASSKMELEYDDSDDSAAIYYPDGRYYSINNEGQLYAGQTGQNAPPLRWDHKELFPESYLRKQDDLISLIKTWILNTDHPISQWERDFAYAIIELFAKNHVDEFQGEVDQWVRPCLGAKAADDPMERNRRFLEESLEVVQSTGMSRAHAHWMVDYVYNREKGETPQEVGGALVTLAALCNHHQIDMMAAGRTELDRIWTKFDKIREKQIAKPQFVAENGCYD